MVKVSINQKNTSDKKLSIEQAYNVCLIFYLELWPSIKPHLVELDPDASSVHELFFLSICSGLECSALWNEAVFRIKKISKMEQRKGLMLTAEETFLCTIEFCKVCRDLYKWDLRYTLNLVESIKINPENHPFECSIWKDAVDRSFKMTSYCALDWTREYPSE